MPRTLRTNQLSGSCFSWFWTRWTSRCWRMLMNLTRCRRGLAALSSAAAAFST